LKKGATIIVKEGPRELARAGAEIFASAAEESIRETGAFRVALSGGSTPRPMYRLSAQAPFAGRINWEKTSLFWVDERFVPEGDGASNYGAAKRDFIDRVPIPRDHVHPMFQVGLTLDQAAQRYEELLRALIPLNEEGFPTFDLVLLGLGKDGHTASLFPGHPALREERRLVVPVKGGDPDVERLTLTLPVINAARRIVFMVAGRDKAPVLRAIFEEGVGELPAQRVAPRSGQLIWLLDQEAASLIPKEVLHGGKG